MREYSPGNPLVFCHIPKCAGNSLRGALIQALQPEQVVRGVDLALLAGYDDLDALSPAARKTFVFSPEHLPADATFVTGHISPGTTMARFPGADHITSLRNPRLRVISQWIHSRSLSELDLRHWGGLAEAFRVGRLPFQEYLQHEMIAPNVDNTMTRFLAWPHPLLHRSRFIEERDDDEILAVAIDRLDRFGHVGVVENPMFLTQLGDWLGVELQEMRLNERTSIPAKRRPDFRAEMNPSTVDLLDHRTRLDRLLWAHVASKTLDADADQVLESTWQKSIDRYAEAPENAGGGRPIRQAAEAFYELKHRLLTRY
jgi:hypothetical protein